MNLDRHTNTLLHREHEANLDLLARVEQAFARPSRRDAEIVALLRTLGAHLAHDVARHFGFEERELFGRMAESGEGDLASLLAEEHATIRAVADDLAPLIERAVAGTLDEAGWDALKRVALELAERLTAHIHKEESALLPLLADLLDDDADRALALAYAAS
ncbi:MAG: hemerythrin domain-containing protein [Burkholderiaceae bacterium]